MAKKIVYYASFQIGFNPRKDISLKEFELAVKDLTRTVPQVQGIEVRFNGMINPRSGKIVRGPTVEDILKASDIITDNYNCANLHLSEFGLDILQGNNNGRKINSEDFIRNFRYIIGHSGEHEDFWGKIFSQDYITKNMARVPFRLKKNYLEDKLDSDMPVDLRNKFLIENGYLWHNCLPEAHKLALQTGTGMTLDIGHVIRAILDKDPKNNNQRHDSISRYITKHNGIKSYNIDYLHYLGNGIEHVHAQGVMRTKDGRFVDHFPPSDETIKETQKGIAYYLLENANYHSCTLELRKEFNQPKNIIKSIDFFDKTFVNT